MATPGLQPEDGRLKRRTWDEPTAPESLPMAEPTTPEGRIEPNPAPDPMRWHRKHSPMLEQPVAADNSSSGGGNWVLLKALLGAIATTVLSVVGFVGALDSGRPVAPPPLQNSEVKNLKQLLDRHRPPAEVLGEVETRVVGLEPRLAAVEKAVSRVRSLPNSNAKASEDPDTVEMYSTLFRILGDDQRRLANLDPSRLTPDELVKRDQLTERVMTLRCTLVAITGRDESPTPWDR